MYNKRFNKSLSMALALLVVLSAPFSGAMELSVLVLDDGVDILSSATPTDVPPDGNAKSTAANVESVDEGGVPSWTADDENVGVTAPSGEESGSEAPDYS